MSNGEGLPQIIPSFMATVSPAPSIVSTVSPAPSIASKEPSENGSTSNLSQIDEESAIHSSNGSSTVKGSDSEETPQNNVVDPCGGGGSSDGNSASNSGSNSNSSGGGGGGSSDGNSASNSGSNSNSSGGGGVTGGGRDGNSTNHTSEKILFSKACIPVPVSDASVQGLQKKEAKVLRFRDWVLDVKKEKLTRRFSSDTEERSKGKHKVNIQILIEPATYSNPQWKGRATLTVTLLNAKEPRYDYKASAEVNLFDPEDESTLNETPVVQEIKVPFIKDYAVLDIDLGERFHEKIEKSESETLELEVKVQLHLEPEESTQGSSLFVVNNDFFTQYVPLAEVA